MTENSIRKEGELSAEEAAIAKKIFVGFGFLGLALAITALVSLIPVLYVLLGIVIFGVLVVVRSDLTSSSNHKLKL